MFQAVIDDTVVYSEVKAPSTVRKNDDYASQGDNKRSCIEFKLGKLEPGQPVAIKF